MRPVGPLLDQPVASLTGDGAYDQEVRFHEEERRTTEVGVAVYVLNHMLEFGRPISVGTT